MKITFTKTELESVVNDSLCAVSDKNTIPVVEGIRFRTEKDGVCSLTTYDLEKGFRAELECDVATSGNYVINAQKLNRIIRFMPDRYITIDINDKSVATITSGRSKFELHALEGNSFPSLPELNGERGFTVNSGLLKKLIGQVSFAIATTDQRPMLCGAYFVIKNDTLKIVACDGNRLAVRERECPITNKNRDGSDLELKFIVPGKTLIQLVKLMNEDEDIGIYLGRKHVIFKMSDKTFFSRLIDSEYIDYNRVIPQSSEISVKVDRMALISSLERASLVTEDKNLGQAKSYVRCEFEGELLKISSNSVTGSVYDEINIEKEGSDLTIGFNCRFLLDALRAADGIYVEILMTSPLMSIVINPVEEENAGDENAEEENKGSFLYMVCPVKMKE